MTFTMQTFWHYFTPVVIVFTSNGSITDIQHTWYYINF